MRHTLVLVVFTLFLISGIAFSAPPIPANGIQRYAVILADSPIAKRFPGRIETTRAAAEPYRQHLLEVQRNMKAQITARHIRITGAVQHVMNAIFVAATPEQAAELRTLPGVKAVTPLRRRYHISDQLTLTNVQQAWSKVGGQGNAGAGIKIAIIDSGIDETHPSFQDSSLTPPAGFPKCDIPFDCQFTNNKVIVARSYVNLLNTTDPATSRPDDYSPLDRSGHGTGVASIAAGVQTSYAGTTISGVAPKAFLGNYKVFGSSSVNPFSSEDALIQALDDAVKDGMDVAVFSLGELAFTGPLDSGAACGVATGTPCDPLAAAVDNAVTKNELVVVAAAGNAGADGYQAITNGVPTFGEIDSPGDAPSALSVGATTNDITYTQRVEVPGSDAPSSLQTIEAFESADGPIPPKPLTAPLIDVSQIGDNGQLCTGDIANGSLNNSIALIQRGGASTCTFEAKVTNAQNAGAIGVIVYDNGQGVVYAQGLSGTNIPMYMLFQADGQTLKNFIDSHPNHNVTMDPTPLQVPANEFNTVASFSSRGPSTGANALKPDIAAVGTDFLIATQYFDPQGDLFSSDRYTTGNGTSFATPLVAGAAALVKQAHPGINALNIKSALVNTASSSAISDSSGSGVLAIGGGLLATDKAVNTNLAVSPSSVSFGLLNSNPQPTPQPLLFTNLGSTPIPVTLQVNPPANLSGAQIQVNNASTASFTVPVGSSITVTASLTGTVSVAGDYAGGITVNGGAVPMEIPVFFLAGDGVPFDIIPVLGQSFDGSVGQDIQDTQGGLGVRVVDQYGAPVVNTPVTWTSTQGGGSVVQGQLTSTATDNYGLAYAEVVLGPTSGTQSFTADAGNGLTTTFNGTARPVTAINANGIVDGATFARQKPVVPGSIVSIFGSWLSDYDDYAAYLPLPLALGNAVVSFDVPNSDPSKSISVVGPLFYASEHQLNVQVPWEVQGQSSVVVKVRIQDSFSATYTLPLTQYQPAFFTYQQNGQTYAAAQDVSFNYVTPDHPIAKGQTVLLYLNGLGPVNNQPATGDPGPGGTPSQLATTASTPVVTIGGQQAAPQFSGLAPGLAGLYQINVAVPVNVGSGAQPVTVSIGGVTSPTVYLPVQ